MFEAEITEIAHNVWESMFGVQLVSADHDAVEGPTLTGIVHIDGAWQGVVTLSCPVELAGALTARLFDDSADADVRDLLGELANQLGGNIKALLPEPSSLSLPVVAAGTDYEITVSDTSVAAVVGLTCDGEPLVITVLERTA